VLLRGRDFGVRRNDTAHGGRLVDLFTPHGDHPEVFVSLHGAYQADNASIAVAAVEAFAGAPLPADLVADVCMVKNHCTAMLEQVAGEAVQLLGGMGYMQGVRVERIFRETKVLSIGGGASEVLAELAAMGREAFQAHDRIADLYDQSGGLADFFMNAQSGRYRESFVEYLTRVYSGTVDADTLPRLCRRSFAELDAEYRAYMR